MSKMDLKRSPGDKPLFIPLKTAYFNAFLAGEKSEELRRYGPRWNERTCPVGRLACLAKGYTRQVLRGRIAAFERKSGRAFSRTAAEAILDCYGTLDVDIACIKIEMVW